MSQGVKIALAGAVAIVVLSYFAVDGLKRARMSGNEASAIGSLRAINSAQAVYASSQCGGGYAPRLARLAAAGMITPDLNSDPTAKSGYLVTLTVPATARPGPVVAPPCEDAVTEYRAIAVPITPGETGGRFFMTDQTGDVLEADNAAFTGARRLE